MLTRRSAASWASARKTLMRSSLGRKRKNSDHAGGAMGEFADDRHIKRTDLEARPPRNITHLRSVIILDKPSRQGWIIAHLRCEIIPMFHLVGETIDAKRAHLRAQAGELVPARPRRLCRPATDDSSATILGHAVRIAHYLYPTATYRRRAQSCSADAGRAACSSADAATSAPACARSRSFRTKRPHIPRQSAVVVRRRHG